MNTTANTNRSNDRRMSPLYALLLMAFAVIAIAVPLGMFLHYDATLANTNKERDLYRQLLEDDNQACNGITAGSQQGVVLKDINLTAGAKANLDAAQGVTAEFSCTIGLNTKDAVKNKEVAAVDKNGYEMGAKVIYFKDQQAAKQYAQKHFEPQRYWSWDTGDPVTGAYTSVIPASPTYFDAYMVRGNALARVSLPCQFENLPPAQAEEKCMGEGVGNNIPAKVVSEFVKSLEYIDE